MLLVSAVVVAIALINSSNNTQDQINASQRHFNSRIVVIEIRDAVRGRNAAYRLCSRQNAVRTYLRTEPTANSRLLRSGVPIMDCSPNLRGGAARPLAPQVERAFVAYFKDRGVVPLTCKGGFLPDTDANRLRSGPATPRRLCPWAATVPPPSAANKPLEP